MTNLGFVGVGGYGRAQLEQFLPFHRSGQVRICALADVSREALAAASNIEGLQDARGFDDYRAMLEMDDLDAVVISAPIPFHEEVALRAIERGVFALLEKPPAPLMSQLERLIAADVDGKVMVAFQHVYSPLLQRMKEIVRSGEIGQPLAFSVAGIWPRSTSYYERAGWAGQIFWRDRVTLDGPCTNGMSHYVNSLFYVGGETPGSYALPSRLEGEAYRARPVPSYDVGVLRGRFDEGSEFQAMFSHAGAEAMPVRLRAQGTLGAVELSDNNKLLCDHAGRTTAGSDGRDELAAAFLAFVEGRKESNLTPLSEMRAYVLATNMMLLSSGGIHSADGRFVTVHHPETPGAIYEVEGLNERFARSYERGGSLDAPWIVPPRMITRREMDEPRLLDLLREGEPPRR